LLEKVSISDIIEVMNKKGHKVFYDGSPNLIGVRNSSPIPNTFNDLLFDIRVFKDGTGSLKEYSITTDPGTHFLIKPMNPKGCAILKPGQYRGLWTIGLHRGKYEALVQVGKCTVLRDNNKDKVLDFDTENEETGDDFGINCHKKGSGVAVTVDEGSAGCQTHADADRFDKVFMIDMKLAIKKWPTVSYSLLLQNDFEEAL
jgi:hypothetical protein